MIVEPYYYSKMNKVQQTAYHPSGRDCLKSQIQYRFQEDGGGGTL